MRLFFPFLGVLEKKEPPELLEKKEPPDLITKVLEKKKPVAFFNKFV